MNLTRFTLMIEWLACVGLAGCNNHTMDTTLPPENNPDTMTVTTAMLKEVLDAFNRHDLDAISRKNIKFTT